MSSKFQLFSLAALVLLLSGCSPTVRLEVPDKPIEINMTVNIKHEILVKVEKEVRAIVRFEQGPVLINASLDQGNAMKTL
jgi:lipoprotein NlpI